MKILIGCEYSGRVRDAFLKAGHDAMSCDLLPTDKPGPHYQGDVRDVISDEWDLMIAFPPCTRICNTGNGRWAGTHERWVALEFVRYLMSAPIRRIAIENPVGAISTNIRYPTQIVEPYYFGDPWKKKTCLWLTNLPPLIPTQVVPVLYRDYDRRNGKDPFNSKLRSLTFPGLANAMAAQWG